MKSLNYIVSGIVIILLGFGNAYAKNSYTVAVLPFDINSQINMDDLGNAFPLLLNAHLSKSKNLTLVERAALKKALDEISMGLSGMVDSNNAAQVGYLTGAGILVTGRIFPVQKDLFFIAKIVGVETGRVYGETVKIPMTGDIDQVAQALAKKISNTITSKGDTLIAIIESKEDVITSMKKIVQGKKLPTVAVTITEESLGREILDPAAQTEISFILHKLGFTLIDLTESNVRADIEITGEAFSEFGLRKGSLVSSKGRVEIKAVDVKTGELIHISRQVAVAVDLSREIAGKAAISKATANLASALVSDLVK